MVLGTIIIIGLQIMKLRFEVNQAEAFRRGINIEKSIVTIDVDPSSLNPFQRSIIADRLRGIDVCRLELNAFNKFSPLTRFDAEAKRHYPKHVIANDATLDALIDAIMEDDKVISKKSD